VARSGFLSGRGGAESARAPRARPDSALHEVIPQTATDKGRALPGECSRGHVSNAQRIAYVGVDLLDLAVLRQVASRADGAPKARARGRRRRHSS
jgi:hypothetical protein